MVISIFIGVSNFSEIGRQYIQYISIYCLPISEEFETPMNIEITIVKTVCDFGHTFLKKQPFWPFFIRILAISY